MLNRPITILFVFVALFCVFGSAQEPIVPLPGADRAGPNITYGRVKEFTAGEKLVIDIDNALDKHYDLTETNTTYKVAKDLKVGDTVMITEKEVAGKKTIEVVKHSGGGVKHGDSDRKKQ
jgi:hypothetical protein